MTTLTQLGKNVTRASWALLALRLLVGFGFAAHGYAKLARGPAQFAIVLGALGLPWPHLAAWLTVFTELLGGALLLLGVWVRPVSVPLAVVMLTALFTVHLQFGFSSIRLKAITETGVQFGPIGYEMNLLYLASLLVLALSAPTPLALEYYLKRGRRLVQT